ncbi:hypothetical protein TNCV_2745031 [Trichonephila clavipes]|nr:hypothetical protein TNCV_2745031 [Trichonephila clavipes]
MMQVRIRSKRDSLRCLNFSKWRKNLLDEIELNSFIWSDKKKLRLLEALDLLQNLPSECNDALTDDSSDEEVPANNLLEFSSDSEEDDQETEQDPGCSRSC